MEQLILIIHVLCAVGLVGLILLQQGKGATMGASFGSGASQTLFGASGSVGFLGKLTAVVALIFFLTSMSLALLATNKAEQAGEFQVDVPAAVESPVDEQLFLPADDAGQPATDAGAEEAAAAERDTAMPPVLDDEAAGEPEVPAVE